MKDGQMTTILVHNILANNEVQPDTPQERSPIKTLQYVEYVPNNYQAEIQEKIRSRSFYQQKNDLDQKLRFNLKKTAHRSIESDYPLKEPKIVDVEFDFFKRSKTLASQYYSLMVDSMQKYINKVQKGKKKKKQQCQKIKNFGVDIKSITYNPSLVNRKQIAFMKTCLKPELKKHRELKKVSNSNQHRVANDRPNPVMYKQKMTTSLLSENSTKIFSETISHNPQRPKFFHKKISLLKYEKKEEERGLNSKMNRMFNFFTVVLYSYGVYLDRNRVKAEEEESPVENNDRKKQKYYYYIGKGNNKNLLISILKKRWWWAQSKEMSSADFVWTQLKVGTILCKQTSMNYSELEEARPEQFKRPPYDKVNATQSFSKIFHSQYSSQFFAKLPEKQQKKLLRCMRPPNVLHNHYEANYMLGNKKALFHNMVAFRTYKNKDPFEYIPLTFHVEKINSRAFKLFQKKAKQNKNYMWIVKPGQNSNRGQGIFVSDSFQKIKNKISKDSKHTHIIQKYLKNNFLFQRRKFDIRTYLLLVSIGGIKKFFWYSEGYLRTSSQIYDLSDLDDPFIHLTNDAIQMNSDNYGKYEKGNKITYHEFQRYVDINYPDEKYSVPNLVQKMKAIAQEVVEGTYFKIDPCRKQIGLELFGMDFLIDSKFKPWLLQVNTNPCLELSSPVLERLIPRMMENLFRIAIDPIFQPAKGHLPKNLACYVPQNIPDNNRFQLIFDSMFDRNFGWEQFCVAHSQNEEYEDEDEEFDDDGDIIKIDY